MGVLNIRNNIHYRLLNINFHSFKKIILKIKLHKNVQIINFKKRKKLCRKIKQMNK